MYANYYTMKIIKINYLHNLTLESMTLCLENCQTCNKVQYTAVAATT